MGCAGSKPVPKAKEPPKSTVEKKAGARTTVSKPASHGNRRGYVLIDMDYD